MQMSVSENLLARAARANKRIVFPEGADPRVVAAAYRIAERKLGRPVLIGEPAEFDRARRAGHFPEPGFPVVAWCEGLEEDADLLVEIRRRKNLSREDALKLATDPLFKAALMVRTGKADACVGGAVRTTADTSKARAP